MAAPTTATARKGQTTPIKKISTNSHLLLQLQLCQKRHLQNAFDENGFDQQSVDEEETTLYQTVTVINFPRRISSSKKQPLRTF